MKISKTLLLFICLAILLNVFPGPIFAQNQKSSRADDFKDVPKDNWAYDAIMWMADNKIAEGVGDGSFAPDREITRDEYAKMMVLALKLKLIEPGTPSFRDIKRGSWQYKYIESAKPYMTGFRSSAGDYFHPSETAVREDMAVALVKALGLSGETAEEGTLSVFTDANSISPNLKKYVAIALKHNLIAGYSKDGQKVFDPQGSLTRASAAELLYKSLDAGEEKVTYDEEKVTYDDGNTASDTSGADDRNDGSKDSSYPTPTVKASISGDSVAVSWNRIDSSKFCGYKVVVSKNDSTPQYPDNGYFAYVTDRETTSSQLKAGDCYNGGDFDGQLKSGVEYYFTVTVLYDDRKVTGNVIRLKMP